MTPAASRRRLQSPPPLAILPGCGERKGGAPPETSEGAARGAGAPERRARTRCSPPSARGTRTRRAEGAGRRPADAATAIRKVQKGEADLAVGTEPDLLEARGRGARVVSVAALVQGPFTSLIGPKLSVGSVLGLATKPIGTQGLDYQQAMADTIFQKAAHVVVKSGPDLDRGAPVEEGRSGDRAVRRPGAAAWRDGDPVDRLKVPTFSEYVLVANQDAIGRDGDAIRSFVGALARGTRNLGAANKMGSAIRCRAPRWLGSGR